MQIIGVYEGTKLIPADNHAGVRHEVHGEFQDEGNSYHNYALAECPSEYSLVAQGLDGSVGGYHEQKEELVWVDVASRARERVSRQRYK